MRDYKAECAALRAELKQVRQSLEWERERNERYHEMAREAREQFRKLLVNLLDL